MNNFALLVTLAVICIGAWKAARSVVARSEATRASLERIEAKAQNLRTAIADVAAEVELVLLTPAERESKRFDRLAPLASRTMAAMGTGDALWLLLKTYTDEGTPLVYEVEYVHRELVYRSPNKRDPMAYGKARFEHSRDLVDVRVLFAGAEGGGSLRGLSLPGTVKESPRPLLLRRA